MSINNIQRSRAVEVLKVFGLRHGFFLLGIGASVLVSEGFFLLVSGF